MQTVDVTTGEITGANGRSIQPVKYVITPTGLDIHAPLSFDEWIACGSQLVGMKNALQWCIGDWLAYGEGRGDWGETYAQAMDATQISYDSLRNYTWVSRVFELSTRVDNLSWSHHRAVAGIEEPEKRQQLLRMAADGGWSRDDLAARVRKLQGKPHVTLNGGNNEWYTPPELIEAARAVMGGIDTDPASSDTANRIVRASVYYTPDTNGLEQAWRGNVWMNPPYAQPDIACFIDKLALEITEGRAAQACVLVNNATETEWCQALLDLASDVCLLRGRVKFLDTSLRPTGSPLQGQIVLYIGGRTDAFRQHFSSFGRVLHVVS